MNLEQMLMEMDAYGHPHLHRNTGGWSANVEMHVNATGADFKIRSDFDHATPSAAALQCLERMRDVLRGINKGIRQTPRIST